MSHDLPNPVIFGVYEIPPIVQALAFTVGFTGCMVYVRYQLEVIASSVVDEFAEKHERLYDDADAGQAAPVGRGWQQLAAAGSSWHRHAARPWSLRHASCTGRWGVRFARGRRCGSSGATRCAWRGDRSSAS